MLVVRLQRIGRKGDPVYRLIVQDSKRHPQSENLVDRVGTYNPHTKEVQIETEKLQKYLDNGAQPSERIVKILEKTDIKLPKWAVSARSDHKKSIKHTDKLRRNQPKDAPAPEAAAEETPAAESTAEAETTQA